MIESLPVLLYTDAAELSASHRSYFPMLLHVVIVS